MISIEELTIAVHESALDEMKNRMARLYRRRMALNEEIAILDRDIVQKQEAISAARNVFLSRCVCPT